MLVMAFSSTIGKQQGMRKDFLKLLQLRILTPTDESDLKIHCR